VIRLLEGVAAYLLIVAGVAWLVGIPWGLIAAGVLLLVDRLT
jgi:hypothetical protein